MWFRAFHIELQVVGYTVLLQQHVESYTIDIAGQCGSHQIVNITDKSAELNEMFEDVRLNESLFSKTPPLHLARVIGKSPITNLSGFHYTQRNEVAEHSVVTRRFDMVRHLLRKCTKELTDAVGRSLSEMAPSVRGRRGTLRFSVPHVKIDS